MANQSLVEKAHVTSAIVVVPNDTVDLTTTALGLFLGNEGDVKVLLANDTIPVIFKNASGTMPTLVKRVYATGTTATDILALY